MHSLWIPLAPLIASAGLLLYATKLLFSLPAGRTLSPQLWRALQWLLVVFLLSYAALAVVALGGGALAQTPALPLALTLGGAVSVALMAKLTQKMHKLSDAHASTAHREALHDRLTDLPNRRAFLDDMTTLIQQRQRFALLMVDLDKFKQINDAFGHAQGDALLEQVARRVDQDLDATQTAYRLGGDEFALLERDPDSAEHAAQQLLERMRMPFELGELSVDMGASIGLSRHPEQGSEVTLMLSRADMALLQAKQKSLGWAWFNSDLETDMRRKLTISSKLRRAVAENQLLLHYQPICHSDGSGVYGLEALLRWPVRDGEFISPQEFIPIAEEERMVDAITNWVVLASVQQLGVWLRQGFDIRMNINLSALDLQDPALWTRISQILRTEGVPPERITLELTESAVMHDVERATKTLQAISDGGAKVAIDDFGTGYSSMARLKGLPIHQIKIDRCFVRDVVDSPQDAAIVNATVFLAKNLLCKVTAEGVETAQAAEHLRDMGCDYLQGYHFARPQPAADITQLLFDQQSASPIPKAS